MERVRECVNFICRILFARASKSIKGETSAKQGLEYMFTRVHNQNQCSFYLITMTPMKT